MNAATKTPRGRAVLLAAAAAVLVGILGFLATDLSGWYIGP